MRNRELFVSRLLEAFVLASAMFVLVFFLAYSVSYMNYRAIASENSLIEQSISNFEGVLSEFDCDTRVFNVVSEDLDEIADKLTLLEKRFGKRDPRVLEQKQLYSLLEYRHLLITDRFNEQCSTNYLPVLFFYSNLNAAAEASGNAVGYILTAFEREDSERIMIYSFDYNLESEVIASLVSKYGINSTPSVVANGRVFYPKNINELEQYL